MRSSPSSCSCSGERSQSPSSTSRSTEAIALSRRASRRAIGTLARFRHPLLWLWLLFVLARNGPPKGIDWEFFTLGGESLFGNGRFRPGGLHLFATEPELHGGPLSMVVATCFRLLFADSRFAAALTMAALGPVLVLVAERAAVRARGLREAIDEPLLALVTLVSGAAFLRGWILTSWVFLHIEEGLVIVAAIVAVWCVTARRAVGTAAAVGLAIGAKASGVLLLPLLACFPRRQMVQAAAVAAALAGGAWLPFLAADTGTIETARGKVGIFAASGLRVLGVDSPWPPGWVRPTQVVLGLVLGVLAVWRGRWQGVVLVVFAVRLALDPSTSPYYTPLLACGALVWDLAGRRPLPIWTPLVVATHVLLPRLGAGPDLEGIARLAVAVAAIAAVLALPTRRVGAVGRTPSPA